MNILLGGIVFCFGLIVSHRSAGPIYALERYVDNLLDENAEGFKLREQDYHQENLQRIAKKIKELNS